MAGLNRPAPLSRRERGAIVVLSIAYTLVVVVVGVHKGGDLRTHLVIAQRLLDGLPLYPGPPTEGVWWPPFGILVVAPFAALARVSVDAAKAAWAVLLAACVIWSVLRLRGYGWRPVVLALLAVSVPLQGNFEHLNVGPLILALLVAAIAALDGGHEAGAGAWIGLAAALKAFPAVLILYLAARRRWRAVLVASTVAAIATLLPTVPGGVGALGDWVEIAAAADDSSWIVKSGNQSLPALLGRLGSGEEVTTILLVIVVTAVGLTLRRVPGEAGLEVGVVMLLSVLLSPIAWWHYYVLLLPLWLVMFRTIRCNRPAAWPIGLAALLTSGLLTLGPYSWRRMLLDGSIYTWGALLLVAWIVFDRNRPRPAHVEPA